MPRAVSQAADRPVGGDLGVGIGFTPTLFQDPVASWAKLLGKPTVWRVGSTRDLRSLDAEGAIVESAAERLGTGR